MSFSLNAAAARLVDDMLGAVDRLRIGVTIGKLGEVIVDCGALNIGGIEAGLRLAEICMGGLGTVSLAPFDATPNWPWHVVVRTSNPVVACLASQYAGWALKHEGAEGKFSALGSGPARVLARKEPLFQELGYREEADRAVLVLETAMQPPEPLLEKIAAECCVSPNRLAVLFAPTSSLAGSVQIAARSVEVALHKAHVIGFPIERIVDAAGSAPLSPPNPDNSIAMGRTNDSIIFGGSVHLFVTGAAADARGLAEQLPSSGSRDYGAPFTEVFRRSGGDFYAIDPMLFSPAKVTVTALEAGETFCAGSIATDLLDASFG